MIFMSQSESEFHKETAKKCFNEAWDYLDKKNRTAEDEQQMLHLAHAARYHRSFVGTARNFAVGDWQLSRVYAALNEPRLALQFAKSALEITQKNNLLENLPSAYEGMARAYAVAKEKRSAMEYIKKAREALDKATGMGAEDKKIYSDQIVETEALLKQ
jgi:tetratricopeptide (TPR) repeat protein